jgi:Ca2+-binding EF-hand superfamily protein
MKIDLTEEQFSDMMKTLDRNGDGKISFIEFDTYLKNVNIKNT